MKNYCVNVHFAKIFPVFYICWIVLYYILIKWEGIDKNHLATLHSYNSSELAELLFYLVNNVIVSISFIPLLSISDIFNKDMNRTFIVFIVTFLLPPIINVYSFLIPEAIPDGLMIFEVPITIKPLIIMFNIIYLGALVCCLWNKQQTFYKFYSSFLGISIIYSYLHNYIIDIYSFDIPFKDFGFRLILSLIPFVAFFLLISLNSYILIKTNKSFVNYVPNANKNQSSRKFKSGKTRNKYWY